MDQQPSSDFDAADRRVLPAYVRRAPKFASFIATGAVAGVVIGLIGGFLLPNSTDVGRGTVALLVASGCGLLGVVIGGVLAVMVDTRTPSELKALKEAEQRWSESSTSDHADSDELTSESAWDDPDGSTDGLSGSR